jgi:hypothetical protein
VRHCRTPSTSTPMRTYWPGRGAPAAAGADDDGHGVARLRADLDDAAAQVVARAQRVDEVDVVGRDERGDGHAGQGRDTLAQSPEDGADGGRCGHDSILPTPRG